MTAGGRVSVRRDRVTRGLPIVLRAAVQAAISAISRDTRLAKSARRTKWAGRADLRVVAGDAARLQSGVPG